VWQVQRSPQSRRVNHVSSLITIGQELATAATGTSCSRTGQGKVHSSPPPVRMKYSSAHPRHLASSLSSALLSSTPVVLHLRLGVLEELLAHGQGVVLLLGNAPLTGTTRAVALRSKGEHNSP
jgi:hypothetical protein